MTTTDGITVDGIQLVVEQFEFGFGIEVADNRYHVITLAHRQIHGSGLVWIDLENAVGNEHLAAGSAGAAGKHVSACIKRRTVLERVAP